MKTLVYMFSEANAVLVFGIYTIILLTISYLFNYFLHD